MFAQGGDSRCWLLAFLTVVAVALFGQALFAQITIHVPADQPTIQAGIDAASNGDTVLVAPATYTENIDFHGKAITVTSTATAPTIIDGTHQNSVVTFNSGETAASVLNGFIIQHGNAQSQVFYYGGGIFIHSASPTITNNTIQNNVAPSGGGGIAVYGGSPKIQGNVIQNNTQTAGYSGGSGGGILLVSAGSAQVLGNTIAQNSWPSGDGGGISLSAAGTPTIANNIISGNSASGVSPASHGGGIYIVDQSDALIVQNVIRDNTAGDGDEIYFLVPYGGRGPALVNNTIMTSVYNPSSSSLVFAGGFDNQVQIWNNFLISSPQPALVCDTTYNLQPPTIANNDIVAPYGPIGSCAGQVGQNGNIFAGPSFVNIPSDLRLLPDSVGIDAGSNSAPYLPQTDPDGHPRVLDGNNDCVSTVDIGAYEFASTANTPPVASLSTTQLGFGSQLEYTTSAPQTVTVTNTGGCALGFYHVYTAAPFAISSHNCPHSLAAGASCGFNITYSPNTLGPQSGTLALEYNAPVSPQKVALSGTGVLPPAASLSAAQLTFGPQPIQTSSSQSVTLTNSGGALLNIAGISATAPFAQSNNCPASLAAGASCTITVGFRSDSPGTISGSLSIGDNASESPHLVSLNGTATDFAISFTSPPPPASVTLKHGTWGQLSVIVGSLGGAFNQSVALSCSGLPSGAVCSYSPEAAIPGSYGFLSTLTVSTAGNTKRGTFPVNVVGTSGALQHVGSFTLTVK